MFHSIFMLTRGDIMNKIIGMMPATAFLLYTLYDPFQDLLRGDIGRFLLGLCTSGLVGAIAWFISYRFLCTDMK